MAYINKSEYNAFLGVTTTLSDADFGYLSDRASDVIDALTMYKITAAGGFDSLPPFVPNSSEAILRIFSSIS